MVAPVGVDRKGGLDHGLCGPPQYSPSSAFFGYLLAKHAIRKKNYKELSRILPAYTALANLSLELYPNTRSLADRRLLS